MTSEIKLTPGTIVKKGTRRLVIVDSDGFDAVIATPVGGGKEIRVRLSELVAEKLVSDMRPRHELTVVTKEEWDEAFRRFQIISPLLKSARPVKASKVQQLAKKEDCHVATIYRWLQAYSETGRVSALLRKKRADREKVRLDADVETVIVEAIETKFLTAEKPDVATVIEEVNLLCDERKLERPHANTVRNRVLVVPDRLKMARRRGKKIAAQHSNPCVGAFRMQTIRWRWSRSTIRPWM